MKLGVIVLLAVIVISLFILGIILFNYYKKIRNTQSLYSDREILESILGAPDQMITAKELAKKSPLSKMEAKIRLDHLVNNHVIGVAYDKRWRRYYTLLKPVKIPEGICLSQDPFMTLYDMINIFKFYDYKVRFQDFIFATGLPLNVLKKELAYFEKEGIVKKMYLYSQVGSVDEAFYVLNEPYRTNPDAFIDKDEEFNFELKDIYEKAMVDRGDYDFV